MSVDSSSRPDRFTTHEARQRLEHVRQSRLAQLRTLDASADGAEGHLVSVQAVAIRQVLAEVEAAFSRLDDGSYASCLGCGERIPAERLEILPYTRFCVGCRQRSTTA